MPKLYLGEKLIYGESLAELASVAGEFGYGVVADGAGGVYSVPLFGGEAAFGEVKITASDGAALDDFGGSVAVGSGRIVVAAPYDDDNGTDSGSAYIFDLDGNELSKITASDGAPGDEFGESVAVGSGRIVVGATRDDDNGSNSGSVYIYQTPIFEN